ncbi:uncharacterized protein BX664DRAFT_332187 [Halteromyces radiatus]|uniref:uncharacterized protein n=1 Tax=Halteromyces radiatus TaxID=101107 RepID=UPI00221EC410|nr:uncharacterized protein BX664DRAFT_332187 [Halteromyces radiatus]KAI8089107.1 hypothetical protein BX664DRAFT_332187 [Halteromyces radiatus]
MELVLGKHNGVVIKGKNPRRPRIRKEEERMLLESTMRLNKLAEEVEAAHNNSLYRPYRHVLDMIKSDNWTVEERTPGEYTIILNNPHHLFHFIYTLGRLVLHPYHGGIYTMPSANLHDDDDDDNTKSLRKYAVLPYINFHGELYAKAIWKPRTQWSLFHTALPALLDDCIHYILCCMNHYYPIRPKRVMIKWYSSLPEPSKDPLVLALGLFWARHVFIHHFPSSLLTVKDNKIVEVVQCKLAEMVREALSDCFDIPHIHHVYALSLCNMTNQISNEQKAIWHTMAVRMAIDLRIRPSEHPTTDEEELHQRVWWYLFHVDHFLLESGIIPNSILSPRSDDHDALLALLRPTPCTLDEPDEARGALVWNNILKLWLIRRKLVKEIERIDPQQEEDKLILLLKKVRSTMDTWRKELPSELQLDSSFTGLEGPNIATEACYVLSMERCTNMSLLMRYFFPITTTTIRLKDWQREAIMTVVECSIEFVRIRGTLVQFAPCQTWPGDLKRTVEMLISCIQYPDPEIVVRSQLCLMRALRVLRCYEELQWRDDTCLEMVKQIEQALETTAGGAIALDSSLVLSSPTLSSNNKNNKKRKQRSGMEGIMLFDRKLQPRNQYYQPPPPMDPQDQISRMLVFEDMSKFYQD